MSSLEMLEEGLTPVEPPRPKADPPPLPPGFVPPLPSIPHPDDLKKKKEEKDSSDDSSDAENGDKNGYRSKYRNRAASSGEDEEDKPTLYKASMSSFLSAVTENVKGSRRSPQTQEPAPPPVKRYY